MTISDDTMNIYQRAWHYLGLWSLPSQPRRKYYTAYSILVNSVTLIIYNMCLLLSLFVAASFDDVIETLLVASCTVTTTVKVLLLISSRREISRLISLMKLLEADSITNSDERSILLDAKRKSALATSFFIYSKFVCLLVLILNTLFKPERSFLSSSLDPFDWQSNIVVYWVAIVFQAICISCIAMLIMSVDMWRVAACFMLSGFLDVLCGRMKRLGRPPSSKLEGSQFVMADTRFHEKEMIDCVKYHILCMRYFSVLKKACELHYFVQLVTSTFFICAVAYLLTTFHAMEDVSKFIWLIGTLINLCFQLAIPCYLGSYLSNKTDKLSFSLYESNWPDMSPEYKSTMRIILEVTKKPIYLCTIWNVFIISLPTFLSVVRSAFSLLSFLEGMK